MYLNYYRLKQEPFHITPDPEFLYLSPSHREALAAIIYGIEQKKGFVAIVGAVGVGKTTILRSYLETADKNRLKTIYIFNARLTFEGLLKTIYEELGLPIETTDTVEMVNRLFQVLVDHYAEGNSVILVIDEAQNMPVETLENLRMLSNLETPKDKLIQIVLVGQPEFEETLNLNQLRQLKQRIAIRSTILPLTKTESLEYIRHRLHKAGGKAEEVFSSSALDAVIRKANGIPRVMNILCDNALITGFGYQRKPIGADIVREVLADFDGKKKKAFLWSRQAIAALAVLCIGAGIFLLLVYGKFGGTQVRDELPPVAAKPAPANKVPSQPKETVTPPRPEPAKPQSRIEAEPRSKTVEKGDTLMGLTQDVYGRADSALIKKIQQSNPHISNPNLIITGSKIVFPGMEGQED